MTLSAATALIEEGIGPAMPRQTWADLGAGNGLFTRALAPMLGHESVIYAVDRDARALKQIEQHVHGVTVITVVNDFLETELHHLDGILMANSLHFIAGQVAFLQQARRMLKPAGRLLLVEYDTDRANTWVPYPISFATLTALANNNGWAAQKLATQPSRYQAGGMYAAAVQFRAE